MNDVNASLKRGLKRGGLLVAGIVIAAMALAAFQMLTAPTKPQPAHTKAQPTHNAPKGNVFNAPKENIFRGTVWTVPPGAEQSGWQLEFCEDGSLVATSLEDEVEKGDWRSEGNSFTAHLSHEKDQLKTFRELKGTYSDDTLHLKVKTTISFTNSGATYPGKEWVDWAWGWKKRAVP